MAKKVSEAERKAILQDIQAGELSRNAVARKHGRSMGTITRIAEAAGIGDTAFDRAKTKNATQARAVDMAELRSRTARRFLEKANAALDRLDRPCIVYSFGGMDNHYAEHTMAEPPASEFRSLMTAAAVAMDKHLVTVKHDVGVSGVDEAVSVIGNIVDALRGNVADDVDAGD